MANDSIKAAFKQLWGHTRAELSAKANATHKHSAADIQAGTLTGIVGAMSNIAYTTAQVRSIILSTGDPAGGSNGQVWIKYK